ncbi:MAG: hypothetical protein ABSH25_21660 [Syntrophorhabdales bacterium]
MAGTGGLFTYIAGSPFVYISLFGLTATQYAWAFGTNGLLFVIGSQTNRAILRNHESGWILVMVTAAECAVTAVLLGGSLLGFLPSWAFVALVASYMFCHAFVGPNAGALALLPFSQDVGSASASFARVQMISGALASGLLPYFHDGTRVPMAAMMGACSGLSLILAGVGSLSLRRVR